MDKQHLKIARSLYKPSKKQEALVTAITDLFDKPLPNGVVVTELEFEKKFLNFNDLSVRKVEREHSHSAILVHWYPNHNVSTKNDPFCSAFILEPNELSKLYNVIAETFKTLSKCH